MTCDALNKFMALLATWPEDSGQQWPRHIVSTLNCTAEIHAHTRITVTSVVAGSLSRTNPPCSRAQRIGSIQTYGL